MGHNAGTTTGVNSILAGAGEVDETSFRVCVEESHSHLIANV